MKEDQINDCRINLLKHESIFIHCFCEFRLQFLDLLVFDSVGG